MVPKDGDATTSLGHVLLPHSSAAEWFPPFPSEVPVLQKCLLALVLSPDTSEKSLALHSLSTTQAVEDASAAPSASSPQG